MANVRVMPPSRGDRPSITVNGRTYSCALGSFIDIPDFDAELLAANKWTQVGASVGPTANRPAAPNKGLTYMDTTLGFIVVFDDLVWRNPATGGAI